MKILHVAPLAPYNIGWSYQENLLPKYHRKLGHEVCLVVSPFENTKNGKVDVGESNFMLEDGIKVYRRRRILGNNFFGKSLSYTNIWDILLDFKPNFVMIHSLMTLSVFQIIKYKKEINPNCIIIQDNHIDENNGKKKNKIFTNIFYTYWAFVNKFAKKYISKYYGVNSWRRDFIINRFKIEKERTDVLIMGADIDDIDFSKKENYRKQIEQKYNLNNQFIIVTGGKIDKDKNTVNLIKSVKNMKNVKLLIFGDIADRYKCAVEKNMNSNVILLGWKNNHEINELFVACDLAIFPGQHSVLWEQACACKIPCLFSHWPGMEHLNNGGNSEFFKDISENGLRNILNKYIKTDLYYKMKSVAQSNATDIYSYYDIAKKSIETISNI